MTDPIDKKRNKDFDDLQEKKKIKVEDKKTQSVSKEMLGSLTTEYTEKYDINATFQESPPIFLMNSMIEECKKEREQKFRTLEPDTQKQILELSKDLSPLFIQSKKYCDEVLLIANIQDDISEIEEKIYDLNEARKKNKLSDQINQDITLLKSRLETINKEEQDHSDKLKKIQAEMTKTTSELLITYKTLALENDMFSPLYGLDRIEEQYRATTMLVYQEQILNKCVNSQFYLIEVRKNIETHKNEIIKIFYPGNANDINLSNFSFEIFSKNLESHNRGKVACQVTCYQGANEVFSFFYKPRNAEIDKAVIELFSNLNIIEKKSLDEFLPVYKIVRLNNVEEWSLWEHIKGVALLNKSIDRGLEINF